MSPSASVLGKVIEVEARSGTVEWLRRLRNSLRPHFGGFIVTLATYEEVLGVEEDLA